MDMAIERLTECIGRAVRHAQFRSVYGNCFESPVMRKFYARKMRREYCLSNTDAISVRETELTGLVSELAPMVVRYCSPETGAVGNGLYTLMGSVVSPRFPSVEDYAKILVLAATRLDDPERVTGLFAGWLEGRPVRVGLCALLKGVTTDGRLKPVDGLCLETLPRNGDEFPRALYGQTGEHDIRHVQYAQRAMLSLEHDVGPALYSPDGETGEHLQLPPRPLIRNPELSSVSVDSLCRAMSVETNNYVDWFMHWWDYGDVDAFFLNPGNLRHRRDISNPPPGLVSEEQLGRCLELHGLLDRFTRLDLCISRWLRSKQANAKEEQLVELRIALESVLLADDHEGEKTHRLATRGAWLLGETVDKRKAYFRTLRDAYDFASTVLHAGSLNKKNTEKLATTIGEAQDLCRAAILRITKARVMPDWSDVVFGKRFRRAPDKNNGRVSWDADSMIKNAMSLQRVAKELDKNGGEAGQSDQWLFQGVFLAGPILLSLATEIALKAWQCLEREEAPDRTHDLLRLFDSLKQDTQEMLEARMRKVSPFSVAAERPGMQNLTPDLQDMLAARVHPIRTVLSSHCQAFQRWRYSYEKKSFSIFESSEIDLALTVIVDAYGERRRS